MNVQNGKNVCLEGLKRAELFAVNTEKSECMQQHSANMTKMWSTLKQILRNDDYNYRIKENPN